MGSLGTAAMTRMDDRLPWYRALSAEDRSWVGLVAQAGIAGLDDLLHLSLDAFQARVRKGAVELKTDAPGDLTMEGWWDQARTLEEE